MLAVTLADYPFDAAAPCSGEARSRTCGSAVAISCSVNEPGEIEALGLNVRACAIGQAAAAIFAREAMGQGRASIADFVSDIEEWLSGQGVRPDWPGLELLEPAIAYPARHGAILLPWKAAQAALGKAETAS